MSIEFLKEKFTIIDVAKKIGLSFVEKEYKSVAISCFNKDFHSHGDKNPSLLLQPKTNTFHCLGCDVHGDIFNLIQGYKNCSFEEAITFLEPNYKMEKDTKEKEKLFQEVVENSNPLTAEVFWKKRGISDETKKKFGLVLTDDYLLIPLGNGKNKKRNFKIGPRYQNPVGEASLFKAGDKAKELFLSEGELDAIKIFQDINISCWSATTGSSGDGVLQKHITDFDGIEKIYIGYDNDIPGKKGAWKAAKTLGMDRCYLVSVPKESGKDWTEYFDSGKTKDDFILLLQKAKKFSYIVSEDVVSYADWTPEQLKEIEFVDTMPFGIKKIDITFKLPCGLTIIAAPQGVGKSWFGLFLILQAWLLKGKTSVFFTLEMSEQMLRLRALQQWSHLTLQQMKDGCSVKLGMDLLKKDIMLVYPFGNFESKNQTPEQFERDITNFYKQGRRVFVLDHIHQLKGMNNITKSAIISNEWSEMLQKLKHTYPDIWLIVFAQVTKSAAKAAKFITKEDIRYGADIIDRCDVFISLNRHAKKNTQTGLIELDQENREVVLILDKNRLTDVSQTGWQVHFSSTGNFIEIPGQDVQDLFNENGEPVKMDDSLKYNEETDTFELPLDDED